MHSMTFIKWQQQFLRRIIVGRSLENSSSRASFPRCRSYSHPLDSVRSKYPTFPCVRTPCATKNAARVFSPETRGNSVLFSTLSKINSNDEQQSSAKQLTSLIVAQGRTQQWSKILDIYSMHREHFNHVHFATTMNQLGRIRTADKKDTRLGNLMEDIHEHLKSNSIKWDVRAKVTVLHAIAKMSLHGPCAQTIAHRILEDAAAIVKSGNIQSMANAAWACGKMKVQCPSLFEALDQKASHIILEGSSQGISNIAWACGRLHCHCPNLLRAIDDEAFQLVQEGHPQATANTLWAFATLGIKCPTLCAAINEHAPRLIMEGSPQNISNMAWALATLGHGNECLKFFHAIQRDPLSVIENGTPQAVSNTAWAYATLALEGNAFFQSVDTVATSIVERGVSHHISILLWSYAVQGVHCPNLCKEVEIHASTILSLAFPQNAANVIWSFATMNVACPTVCIELERRADELVRTGNAQCIANIAWSMTTLGFQSPKFFKALDDNIERFISTCNDQELLNLCFSFAILDMTRDHEDAFMVLWDRANNLDWGFLPNIGRVQLVTTYLMASTAMDMPLPWGSHLSVRLHMDKVESNSQQDMSDVLNELNFDHETEISPFPNPGVNEGLLAIDAGCKVQKIAVEYDGPSHFLYAAGSRDPPRIQNGTTIAKRRFLERLGWKVVNIPYFDWESMETKEEKKLYMSEKLEKIGYVS